MKKKVRIKPILTAAGLSVATAGYCFKAQKTAMQTILITSSTVAAAIATVTIASRIVKSAAKER